MGKIVAFLRWPDDDVRFDALLARAASLAAVNITVDRIIPRPEGLPYKPPTDPGDVRYDAILSLRDPDSRCDWQGMANDLGARAHAYLVDDRLVFERGNGGRPVTAAYKIFSLLNFHADLPDSAARRSWRIHAPLAEKVHVGASRYVQNWVVERLSEDAPPARGMPELSFPTLDDLTQRFFDSPRGQEEVLHDISHFVAGGPRFYVEEHVLQ